MHQPCYIKLLIRPAAGKSAAFKTLFASLTIGMMESWNIGMLGLYCIAFKNIMIHE
jgi:hypothetical protein